MENQEIEKSLLERIGPFLGIDEANLGNKLGIFSTSKNHFGLFAEAMVGPQFLKLARQSGIVIKTIRTNEKGGVKESMSLPPFKFVDLMSEKWESSKLHDYFANSQFLFIVFKNGSRGFFLEKCFIWKMPEQVLDSAVKSTWERTYEILSTGNVVKEGKTLSSGQTILVSNFPGMAFNSICHVRPHAANSSDTYPLPVPDKKTGLLQYPKQSFWLNSTYVAKIASGHD